VVDVYPSLTCRDLEAAVVFLERAFGLEMDEAVTDDGGRLRLVTMRHGVGRVLLQPDLPGELHGSHIGHGWVYVAVPDVDAHFAHAVAAGAHVLGEPHDALGGAQRGYSARDPEGNLWSFGVDRPGQ
jgi:uncharacterized glyoxalase superfamily protein PhnB